MPILGIVASSQQGGISSTAYESIATVTVGAGGTSAITFSSIPQTYQHLQIRCNSLKSTNPGTLLRINGISTNYANHILYGDGAGSAQAYTDPNYQGIVWALNDNGSATVPTAAIVDILDYASTTKLKVIRAIGGADLNGSGNVYIGSGMYTASTQAITSLTFFGSGANYNQNTQIALYGIKG